MDRENHLLYGKYTLDEPVDIRRSREDQYSEIVEDAKTDETLIGGHNYFDVISTETWTLEFLFWKNRILSGKSKFIISAFSFLAELTLPTVKRS